MVSLAGGLVTGYIEMGDDITYGPCLWVGSSTGSGHTPLGPAAPYYQFTYDSGIPYGGYMEVGPDPLAYLLPPRDNCGADSSLQFVTVSGLQTLMDDLVAQYNSHLPAKTSGYAVIGAFRLGNLGVFISCTYGWVVTGLFTGYIGSTCNVDVYVRTGYGTSALTSTSDSAVGGPATFTDPGLVWVSSAGAYSHASNYSGGTPITNSEYGSTYYAFGVDAVFNFLDPLQNWAISDGPRMPAEIISLM